MKILMNFLMACAVLAMLATGAMAGDGGGGAKDDGTIVVKNQEAGYILLVKVGAPSDTKLSTILAEGAQLVQPKGTASFDVAAGSHDVFAILVNDTTYAALTYDVKSFNVGKNQTVNVSASAAGPATVLN